MKIKPNDFTTNGYHMHLHWAVQGGSHITMEPKNPYIQKLLGPKKAKVQSPIIDLLADISPTQQQLQIRVLPSPEVSADESDDIADV
jgi:hypothetical protein